MSTFRSKQEDELALRQPLTINTLEETFDSLIQMGVPIISDLNYIDEHMPEEACMKPILRKWLLELCANLKLGINHRPSFVTSRHQMPSSLAHSSIPGTPPVVVSQFMSK